MRDGLSGSGMLNASITGRSLGVVWNKPDEVRCHSSSASTLRTRWDTFGRQKMKMCVRGMEESCSIDEVPVWDFVVVATT